MVGLVGVNDFPYKMCEWLQDNCKRNNWQLYTRYDRNKDEHKIPGWGDSSDDLYLTNVYNGIGFIDKEDAMAFKLKWL